MQISELNKEEHFRVGLASSVVLFGFDGSDIKIYVHHETTEPHLGWLILPSSYVLPEESNEKVIRRMLLKNLNLEDMYLEQLKAFAKVYRNPMGRVINIAYYALIKLDESILEASEKNKGSWVPYTDIPDLGFDHNEIIDYAKERLKRRVKRRPVGFNLLNEEFTIAELQSLYECALGKDLDKRNFRKKIFKSELIIESGNMTDTKDTRKSAKLYNFDEEKYQKMTLKGYDFLF